MVRMILPRATPGRAVPPPHLFEAGPLQLTAVPGRAVFSPPTLLLEAGSYNLLHQWRTP